MTHPLTRFLDGSDLGRADLAKAAGTTRQTIYRIERGEQNPSLDMIWRLIKASGGKLKAADFLPDQESAA